MSVLRELMRTDNVKSFSVEEDISIEQEMISFIKCEKDCDDIYQGLSTLYEICTGLEEINGLVSIENIIEINDYKKIKNSLDILLQPVGLESNFPIVNERVCKNTIAIAKEDIKSKITTIKDFVIKLFKKFTDAMKKLYEKITSAFRKLNILEKSVSKKVEYLSYLSEKSKNTNFTFKMNFGDFVPPDKELDYEYWVSATTTLSARTDELLYPNTVKKMVDKIIGTKINIDNTDSLIESSKELLSVIMDSIERQRSLVTGNVEKIEDVGKGVFEYFEEMLGRGILIYKSIPENRIDSISRVSNINKDTILEELKRYKNIVLKNTGWDLTYSNKKTEDKITYVSSNDFHIIRKIWRTYGKFFLNTEKDIDKFKKVKIDLDSNVELKIYSLFDSASKSQSETSSADLDIQILSNLGNIITESYKILTEPSVKLSAYFIRTFGNFMKTLNQAATETIKSLD